MSTRLSLPAEPVSSFRLSRAVVPAGVVVALIGLIWPALSHAFEVWTTTEEFSFGMLVLPIAGGLIWWRWASLKASAGAGSVAGLPIILLALGLYLLGQRLEVNALAGIAVSPLLWGTAVYLWGWRLGRILAFPLAFLVFGLGLYRGLLDSVGFTMQGITAVGAETLARALGTHVVREGLVLSSDQFAFIVAEACSGMSSLVSLLALAALWTYVTRGSLLARLVVMLSVLPLVVLANTTRVTLVLLVASWFGQDTALGFFHGASSLILFGVALGGLVITSWMVGCRAPDIGG